MRKIKNVLGIVICFTMLLGIRPVFAAESRVITLPCDHTVVYFATEQIDLVPIDDDYHCPKLQVVTKCAQCEKIMTRDQIFWGDLKHHHFSSDNENKVWKCECGAKKNMP